MGRGAAAAALLAVPIAVAGVIGFNGGLGGVAGGFFSALDGPETQDAEAAPSGGLGGALGALVAPDPGDTPPDTRDSRNQGPGNDPGPGGAPPDGGDPPAVELPGTPDVTVPINEPNGGIDTIVDDVNRAVGGLTGNR